MIHDHMNLWLLRPGVGGFGNLSALLDDTDARTGAEQFGECWQPIAGTWQLKGSVLYGTSGTYELLGAIRLVAANELVMIFESGHVAIIPGGSRDYSGRLAPFAVAKLDFEVTWLPSTVTP